MNSQKRLLYLFPAYLSHPGLNRKVHGQINAFASMYEAHLLALSIAKPTLLISHLLAYILFTLKAIGLSRKTDVMYIRYNPKFLLLFLYLTKFKSDRLSVEINGDYEAELTYLNHPTERACHRLIYPKLRQSRAQLLYTNETLYQSEKAKTSTASRCYFLQNGYTPLLTPTLSMEELSIIQTITTTIEALKKGHKKIGVLVATVPSPNTVKMIETLTKNPDIYIIKWGPKCPDSITLAETVLEAGTASPQVLERILPYFDFGISPKYSPEIGFTSGSVLKTGEYLASGLPVITDYEDSLRHTPLSEYILNISTSKLNIADWIAMDHPHSKIAQLASEVLNWEKILRPILAKL